MIRLKMALNHYFILKNMECISGFLVPFKKHSGPKFYKNDGLLKIQQINFVAFSFLARFDLCVSSA